MSLYKRGGIWWISLSVRGRRVRRSTRTADRQKSKREHDELAARLWQERQSGKTFYHALAAWLKEQERSRNEKNAIKQIKRIYRDRPLVDVTPESIAEALADKSASTYNRLVNTIRAAINVGVSRGWMESAPKFKRRKTRDKRTVFLTLEQWDKLRPLLPEHQKDLADFALATGLRWSNVTNLEWSQVDLTRKLAWIHNDQAKDDTDLSVPLSAAAMQILERRKDIHDTFVFTYRGRVIKSPKTAWNKAREKAGLPGFKWHYLRHTWASWHAMNGTPLAVLQELGGWSSLEMVKRYAHLARSYTAQFAANSKPVSLKDRAQNRSQAKKKTRKHAPLAA